MESTGAGKDKGLIPFLDDVPAKKIVLFCDGGVFFLDRGLLMGASMSTCYKFNISNAYLRFSEIAKLS